MQIKTRTAAAEAKLAKKHDRTRNEDQTAIDGEIGKTVKAWLGDPPKTVEVAAKMAEEKRPRVAFAVAPDDKAELKRMIRRATALHKVGAVFFEDSTDEGTGEVVVTLTVGPPPAKTH